jgi:hypothetical protein
VPGIAAELAAGEGMQSMVMRLDEDIAALDGILANAAIILPPCRPAAIVGAGETVAESRFALRA